MAPTLQDWARTVLAPSGQVPARHHLEILKDLTGLAEGGCDRLMLLMPPGSAKSTYASVIFPPWWFLRHPTSAVIVACHTEALAWHFGRRVRRLVGEHADVLGYGLTRDDRAAGRFSTTAGGQYFAAGVRGPITGRRADLVLVDDPIKSHAEADSATLRDGLWDWWQSELLTRLKPGGRVVLVMTRWHEDDLGGRLLATDEASWRVIRLPALAEANDPLGRPAGAPLWPEWEDAAALARKRLAVGPRVWSALYQQNPQPVDGLLFQTGRVGLLDAVPDVTRTVRAWDLAATAVGRGRDPDWTVGLKLARNDSGQFIVLDIVRLRGGPHEVEAAIVATARADGHGVPIGLPQDPGQAGKQQVAWLTGRLAGFRVAAGPESGSKLTRAGPVASQVDAGNLALLRARWNRAFLDELRDFPQGRKDDQVDALARAFTMLSEAAAPARRVFVPVMAR
jgi:predicted phage terminase large subunit-like protein